MNPRSVLPWVLWVGLLIAVSAWPATTVVAGSGRRIEGSGKPVDEVRALSGYSRLQVNAPVDVELKAGATERVTVRADDNIAPLIETSVDDGRLKIGIRKNVSFQTRNKVLVTVEFTKMDGVALHGAGDVRADTIKAGIFDCSIDGSGDIVINRLDADTIAVSIAGSGDFTAHGGRAASIGIVVKGSGDVRASNVEAKQAAVRIAGSGDVSVHATDSLQVRISGSGDVRYRGAPKIDKKVNGSGEVRPLR